MTSHLWSSKDSDPGDCEHLISTPEELDIEDAAVKEVHGGFSWLDYSAFFAVGLSMMWTWYFQLLTSSCVTHINIHIGRRYCKLSRTSSGASSPRNSSYDTFKHPILSYLR